ncbi:MAG: hypothetical protein AB1Z98_25900 [Nannocystaceae bacterium]
MTTDPDAPRALVTRVGRAIDGDNLYCGYSVRDQLAGRDGLWSTLSLAVGGPRLSDDDTRLLDDLTACCLAADPRIWPLKAARLAAGYGSTIGGMVVGMLVADGDRVGPKFIEKTAALLLELDARLPADASEADVAAMLDEWVATGRRLFGFGVPFRERDERVAAVRQCVTARGRHSGRYWRLMETMGEHLAARYRLPPNICAAACAVLLDLGMSPHQTFAIQWALALPSIWANADEGAQQREPSLQTLPPDQVRYVGAPPRRSPRARSK